MSPADADIAFETLREHAPFLRRLARALVREESGAEDLVQETWLAALRRPPKDGERGRGWLARIARNRARDEAKLAGRRAARERDAARPEAEPPADELAERVELAREVLAAVRALREPYRETIWLRYYEELAPREIARRQGVPLETVTTRLWRGKAELRERLGERERWLPGLAALAGLREPGAAVGVALPVGLAAVAVAAAGLVLLGMLRGEEREADGGALAQPPAGDDDPRAEVARTEAAFSRPAPAQSERVAATTPEELATASAQATGVTVVTGTVRWELFERRSGIVVAAVRAVGGVPTHELLAHARCSEEDGRFELEVPGGGEVLLVAAVRGRPVITEPLRLPAEGRVEHDLVGCTEGTPLEGRVLGGDGRPLARANVGASRPEVAAHSVMSGLTITGEASFAVNRDLVERAADLVLPPYTYLLTFVEGAYHLASESTTTDEEGRFLLGGLSPGEHLMGVSPDRLDPGRYPVLTLGHRARAHRVIVPDRAAEIVWRERRILLEVRDASGPLDAVSAVVHWHDELVEGLARGTALEDWPLRLELGTNGRLMVAFDEQDDPALHLTRHGHASKLVRLATTPPDAEGRIVVTLPVVGIPSELALRLETGGPPPPERVDVRMWPAEGADERLGIIHRQVAVEGGVARLWDVPPGVYRMTVTWIDGTPFHDGRASIAVREGRTEVELELDPAAAIGLVLDRELGPREALTLRTRVADGREQWIRFGGSRPLPGVPHRLQPTLPPGERTLIVRRGGETIFETTVQLAAGEVTRVPVALPPPPE